MAQQKSVRVCVILPAYNEATVLTEVLRSIPSSMTVNGDILALEPIVVDDGSTDETAQIAKQVPGVTVLGHMINMGVGAATRTGLHYARDHNFHLAVTMDADGQHSAKDLKKMLRYAYRNPTSDLLIGSRMVSTGNMPSHKKFGNRLLSYTTFAIFGAYVTDSQSGFRVFSKTALDNLEFHSNGYGFCSEMIWQAKRAKLTIDEHPIEAVYTDYSIKKGQKSYSGGLRIVQQLLLRRIMELIT